MSHQLLTAFMPEWVSFEGRERVGLELNCPGHHHAQHRIRLWLANPDDGNGPVPEQIRGNTETVEAMGQDFQDLTLTRPGRAGDEPINIRGHFRGWVVDGLVVESFISGIGW